MATNPICVAVKRHDHELRLPAMIQHLRYRVFESSTCQERLHALFFCADWLCLDEVTWVHGEVGAISLRMREVFARGLSVGARHMVLAHNHPSGDCRPSAKDMLATRRLQDIGNALDLELADHLIFTREKVYSMRAGGKL